MATYVSLRATAQRLIQKNGRLVTYTQPAAVDPAFPELGPSGAPVTTILRVAFVNDVISDRNRGLVQGGDKIILVAADDLPGIVPTNKHTVTDGTTVYKIENVDSIDPSDAPVVYEMILRG